MVTMIL